MEQKQAAVDREREDEARKLLSIQKELVGYADEAAAAPGNDDEELAAPDEFPSTLGTLEEPTEAEVDEAAKAQGVVAAESNPTESAPME